MGGLRKRRVVSARDKCRRGGVDGEYGGTVILASLTFLQGKYTYRVLGGFR